MRRRTDTVLRLLSQLRLEELISDTVPFEQAASAFEKIDRNSEDVLQVVLSYV